jgi:hypothetical protein
MGQTNSARFALLSISLAPSLPRLYLSFFLSLSLALSVLPWSILYPPSFLRLLLIVHSFPLPPLLLFAFIDTYLHSHTHRKQRHGHGHGQTKEQVSCCVRSFFSPRHGRLARVPCLSFSGRAELLCALRWAFSSFSGPASHSIASQPSSTVVVCVLQCTAS